jgi:hypothetical protein
MSNIVEKLRAFKGLYTNEAADEIERLNEEIHILETVIDDLREDNRKLRVEAGYD